MAKRRGKGEGGTIVIKREEIIAGGHHGGAWKVAYADFVTAMMAFFLLMWLLNATTEQQRRGIAAYFSPLANVENGFSGTGMVPGGVTPLNGGNELVVRTTTSPVALVVPASAKPSSPEINSGGSGDSDEDARPAPKSASNAILDGGDAVPAVPGQSVGFSGQDGSTADAPSVVPAAPPSDRTAMPADKSGTAARDAAAGEQRSLAAAAGALTRLVGNDPALAASAGQMAIDVTPEGLRIQIMDRDGQPMFERGGTALNARASALLRKVAPFLAGLPEPVSIGGYTDAAAWPAGPVSNWSLSGGRASAARDVLVASGLPDSRITDITGYADRHLLLPAQPMADVNRRIVLTLRRMQGAPAPVASAAVRPPATGPAASPSADARTASVPAAVPPAPPVDAKRVDAKPAMPAGNRMAVTTTASTGG